VTARATLVTVSAIVLAACAVALLVAIRRSAPASPPPIARDAAVVLQASPRDAMAPRAEDVFDAAPTQAGARDEREAVLANLRSSGKGDEVWDAQAGALFDAIGRAPGSASVDGCFIAGCGATFTFPSDADYRRRLDELQSLEAYRAWTGGKRFTSPEAAADGSVRIGLVLYRPD